MCYIRPSVRVQLSCVPKARPASNCGRADAKMPLLTEEYNPMSNSNLQGVKAREEVVNYQAETPHEARFEARPCLQQNQPARQSPLMR
mmetsp:Transcript_19258/g.43859  ORF Transcript_19258/g.43859 Transcript_19258/m.43859 type:complete len:88 (-) Transcript_19258:570-833(-)